MRSYRPIVWNVKINMYAKTHGIIFLALVLLASVSPRTNPNVYAHVPSKPQTQTGVSTVQTNDRVPKTAKDRKCDQECKEITTFHISEPKENPCIDWKSSPKTVVIHYTATPYNTTIHAIANGHKAKFGVEYYIAYHYIIKENGEIVSTRPESCGSIAVRDETINLQAIHIAYIGDGKPTSNQLGSLVTITREIQNRYGMPRDSVTAHADIQPKNKQESMEGMFGSKDNFVKLLREQDKVTIYGKESRELTYMWQAWGDKDFIGTIYQESRFKNGAIGDGGASIGYCQIHKEHQPYWHEEYSRLESMEERLNYCHEKYTQEMNKYGSHGKYFHGFYKKDTHIAKIEIK